MLHLRLRPLHSVAVPTGAGEGQRANNGVLGLSGTLQEYSIIPRRVSCYRRCWDPVTAQGTHIEKRYEGGGTARRKSGLQVTLMSFLLSPYQQDTRGINCFYSGA